MLCNTSPPLNACCSLQVDGQIVSSIGPGLLCLIGVRDGDEAKDAEFMCVSLQHSFFFSSVFVHLVHLVQCPPLRANSSLAHLHVRVARLFCSHLSLNHLHMRCSAKKILKTRMWHGEKPWDVDVVNKG